MLQQVIEIKDAVAFLGAQVAAREQAAKPSPAGTIARIGENVGRAVGEDEPRAGMIGERKFCSRLIRCARTTPATELRSQSPMPSSPTCAACSISSSGCEAPRRNEKFEATANSR